MDYISQSPTHCSKVNIEYVLKCTKFPGKQTNAYIFETNCSSIENKYKKLEDGFNKTKWRKNKHTRPMFHK